MDTSSKPPQYDFMSQEEWERRRKSKPEHIADIIPRTEIARLFEGETVDTIRQHPYDDGITKRG